MPASLLILNCSVSNWLNFPVVKQLLMIIISWFRRLTGLSWAVLIVALQRVAGWWWLGSQATWASGINFETPSLTCRSLGRKNTAVGWLHGSLSLHLSNTDAWGGARLLGRGSGLQSCVAWESMQSLTLQPHPGHLWEVMREVSPSSGRGLVSTSRQEEWQRV